MVGVARAFVRNPSAGRAVQGGSTITQQVVKTILLTPEQSYERELLGGVGACLEMPPLSSEIGER